MNVKQEDVSLAEYLMAERKKLTRDLERKRDSELELLCTWIDVVFLTLEALKITNGSTSDEILDSLEFSNEANSALKMYVEGVVSMYKNYGYVPAFFIHGVCKVMLQHSVHVADSAGMMLGSKLSRSFTLVRCLI